MLGAFQLLGAFRLRGAFRLDRARGLLRSCRLVRTRGGLGALRTRSSIGTRSLLTGFAPALVVGLAATAHSLLASGRLLVRTRAGRLLPRRRLFLTRPRLVRRHGKAKAIWRTRIGLGSLHLGTKNGHAIANRLVPRGPLRRAAVLDAHGAHRTTRGLLDDPAINATRHTTAFAQVFVARQRQVARALEHGRNLLAVDLHLVDVGAHEVALAGERPAIAILTAGTIAPRVTASNLAAAAIVVTIVIATRAIVAIVMVVVVIVLVVMVVAVAILRATGVAPRRERRPADVVVAFAPAHPRRSPYAARHPHPSVVRIHEPATVVVGGPAKGLVGNPQPAAVVGPNPAANRVGLPVGRSGRGVPSPTEVGVVHPRALRGQRGVEVGFVNVALGFGLGGHRHFPSTGSA